MVTHSTLTTKQQFWFDHVQAAIACEGSMAAYAAKHKLSAKALYAWKTRLNNKKPAVKSNSDFIPLKFEPETKPAMGRTAERPSSRVTRNGGQGQNRTADTGIFSRDFKP